MDEAERIRRARAMGLPDNTSMADIVATEVIRAEQIRIMEELGISRGLAQPEQPKKPKQE